MSTQQYKPTFSQRAMTMIGETLIGPISEIERRTGVKLQESFYWFRGTQFLQRSASSYILNSVGEDTVRRKTAKEVALRCMLFSLPMAYFFSFTIPAIAVSAATMAGEAKSGVVNLTNFSTGCLFNRTSDSALQDCRKSMLRKQQEVSNRAERMFVKDGKEKQSAAYQLFTTWKERDALLDSGETVNPQVVANYTASIELQEKSFTEYELSVLKSAYKDVAHYGREANIAQAKMKVNFYVAKATKEGLTPEENADYEKEKSKINKHKGE